MTNRDDIHLPEECRARVLVDRHTIESLLGYVEDGGAPVFWG
jgi:hypothetical protein